VKCHLLATVLKKLGQFFTSLWRDATYKQLEAFVVFLFQIIAVDERALINDVIKQNILHISEKWQIPFLNKQE